MHENLLMDIEQVGSTRRAVSFYVVGNLLYSLCEYHDWSCAFEFPRLFSQEQLNITSVCSFCRSDAYSRIHAEGI